MLRNAHERERNLDKQIEKLKDKLSQKEDKVIGFEQGNEQQKSK
jgi:hypothetical protein